VFQGLQVIVNYIIQHFGRSEIHYLPHLTDFVGMGFLMIAFISISFEKDALKNRNTN
jgi:hypothetical protein